MDKQKVKQYIIDTFYREVADAKGSWYEDLVENINGHPYIPVSWIPIQNYDIEDVFDEMVADKTILVTIYEGITLVSVSEFDSKRIDLLISTKNR